MADREDVEDARSRLRRFQAGHFKQFASEFRSLVERGQDPHALFIGCADSRVMPNMLLGTKPGDLFEMRNVGAIVPPYGGAPHATGAAIEYAVLALGVRHIVVCTHSHCGAMAALYHAPKAGATHLNGWLEHAREAVLPLPESEDVLRRTEQRMVVIGVERLLGYPMVADAVARGDLALHGWHYVIEDGKVMVLDVATGEFRDALA